MTDIFALHLTDITFPQAHPRAGERGAVYGFAIVHSDGVVLFDTGVGTGDAQVEERFRPQHHSLTEALGRHGLGVADVVAVANSHLHLDHCGHNHLFPGKPIYVQDAEYRAAREPGYTVSGWLDFPGATYELLDGEAELLPGMRALPTPGHAPGHQSLVLDAPQGPILLAGQAVHTRDEWENPEDPEHAKLAIAWDADAYAASARRLRDLRPARALFAHDERQWVDAGSGG